MIAHKFSESAAEVKPDTELTRLLERAGDGSALTRIEKDMIMKSLYGMFGSGSYYYRLAGWEWSIREFPEYIVQDKYGSYKSVRAP